ncbi:TniQ family protein [Falsirhodobacter sp. 20TX0035]|nr:TniQ family protein [Falsirhodobacter sp. 20TX0035]MDB6454922.1 TniQ family protein [Falsirhodobacter sp. 20TX0035]
MSRLTLSIHPILGEAAASAASRLAQANRVSLREFLRDMGMSAADLGAGRSTAVNRIAELAGLDAATLRYDTPQFQGGDVWFRGLRVQDGRATGVVMRGCPDCLATQPGLKGIWCVPALGICVEHRRPLVLLWSSTDKLDRWNVAARLPEADLGVDAMQDVREPTEFEHWVLSRLEGKGGAFWLDRFEFCAAVRFCEEFGRAAISTQRAKSRKLPPEQRHRSGATGFQLLSEGEDRLPHLLSLLQSMMGNPAEGPRKIFGGLHDWLAVDSCPEERVPFREILRRHMRATWPVGPGDEVLGEPVLRREVLSLPATAQLLQRPEADLRAELAAAGVPVLKGQSDAWDVMGAEAAADVLRDLAVGLSEDKVLQALCASPWTLRELEDAGLCPDGPDPLAVQAAIDDLLLGAEPVYVAMHDWCSLTEAAWRLQVTLPELIAGIRNGSLRSGRYLQRSGVASILVHVEADPEAMSVDAFAPWQGVGPSELLTFLRRNGFACRRMPGPRRGTQVRMSVADRREFHERFISFRRLGVAARLDWDALRARLEMEGITPTDGSPRIYDRAAIAHLLP